MRMKRELLLYLLLQIFIGIILLSLSAIGLPIFISYIEVTQSQDIPDSVVHIFQSLKFLLACVLPAASIALIAIPIRMGCMLLQAAEQPKGSQSQ